VSNENENLAGTPAATKTQDKVEKLRPTLFIGVGGTGMEVLQRVRRHILSQIWGTDSNRHRVESLADFPIAQFINFDLDAGAVTQSGQSQKQDAMYDLVKFSEEEKLIESFDIEKYSRDDDSLGRYPHIKDWSPLTPQKIRELNIDPSKGAGQIRGISRLYFFDKYPKIKEMIRLKLRSLSNGLSKDHQLKKLQLELQQDKFRVVVVCSVAGGTGSGSFLDMGWLSTWLGRTEVGAVEVELVVFMPSGFQSANKDRTEANGYAALMELETAMRGGIGGRFVGRWDGYDKPEFSLKPYDEVYLVDAGNVAQQRTSDISDVYQMVADALFEDFASADFANRKRSVAVNQRHHKIAPLTPPVTVGRYGDMKLTFSKGYSAFGQALLDTQQEDRRDIRAHLWAGAMLKAFFGVTDNVGVNRATDKKRDEFLAEHMLLRPITFSDFPEFSSKAVALKRSSGEFTDYLVVEELLKDKQGSILSGIQQKVDDRIEGIKAGFKREEWANQVRDTLKQFERDSIRDQDSAADVAEDRIARQRKTLFLQVRDRIQEQLFTYLDNKEFGGLEYVLSLVEQIKDRLANTATGLIAQFELNAARYEEIRDALRTHEYERLMNNLAQTKSSLFGSGEKQAVVVMDQLKIEIANYLKFHCRFKAASEAAGFLNDLSRWLGEKTGVDAQGLVTWNGLVGVLQAGRNSVVDMIAVLDHSIDSLKQELKKDHATYIKIDVAEKDIPLPNPEVLREWADESFKDFGGSKKLFEMLAEPETRSELLAKVRRMAERQIAMVGVEYEDKEVVDPLVEALEQMSAPERQRRFKELLSRAMPWVDANLSRDIQLKPDQYKCLIGVANAKEFSRKFLADIESGVPTYAGITAGQISIFETGIPGRAVCYCELSGIPLTVMRGLEAWRTSYRKEGEVLPVHIHLDSTQFTHPIVPTMDELNGLADDFKSFLLAVMLGVLTRSTQRVPPLGQYMFMVRRGENLKMGNERAFRQNGLPRTYRDQIIAVVNEKLDELNVTQIAALSALASHYESEVYSPRYVQDETGAETPRKGFASAMAGELARELREKAIRKGISERDLDMLDALALERKASWAQAIEGSDQDAYEWEVRNPEADAGARLKYAIRPEFRDAAWLEQTLSTTNVAAQAQGPIDRLASSGGPPPLPSYQPNTYLVAINGQQGGPYTPAHLAQFLAAGKLTQATLVWRQGMATWKPLGEIPELVGNVEPPPLPAGVPPLPGT